MSHYVPTSSDGEESQALETLMCTACSPETPSNHMSDLVPISTTGNQTAVPNATSLNDRAEMQQTIAVLLNPPESAFRTNQTVGQKTLPHTWLHTVAPEHFDAGGRLKKRSTLRSISPEDYGMSQNFYDWLCGADYSPLSRNPTYEDCHGEPLDE
ncbi:hypothetical protein LTS18_008056 [Coniosporium uncinatum]|uniref:Uncharacterized protein n=1 Tax=Coniosporium uncinatum TaxID=93489 RepID=A0ACC3DNK1_9PEZI|nr:hypothetical protein LTS18_008056 [Coniosporium uncinatum]